MDVTLACRSCGRRTHGVAPEATPSAEGPRCPRCGAPMSAERREHARRTGIRRVTPPWAGPPPEVGDQRSADRRLADRRTLETDGWRPRED